MAVKFYQKASEHFKWAWILNEKIKCIPKHMGTGFLSFRNDPWEKEKPCKMHTWEYLLRKFIVPILLYIKWF